MNSDPRRESAPELQVRDDSGGGGDGEENVTFNNNNCFTGVGMFKAETHGAKGKVPLQGRAVFQPIKVKLTVQFTCQVKMRQSR